MSLPNANPVLIADSKLLAFLNHELRSPFNGLLGFSDLLSEKFETLPDVKKKEYVTLVHHLSQKAFSQVQIYSTWTKLISNNLHSNSSLSNILKTLEQSISSVKIDLLSKALSAKILGDDSEVSIDHLHINVAIGSILFMIIRNCKENSEVTLLSKVVNQKLKIDISWLLSDQAINETNSIKLINLSEENYTEGNYRLWIAQSIIKLNKGEITSYQMNDDMHRTTISITIPLNA